MDATPAAETLSSLSMICIATWVGHPDPPVEALDQLAVVDLQPTGGIGSPLSASEMTRAISTS